MTESTPRYFADEEEHRWNSIIAKFETAHWNYAIYIHGEIDLEDELKNNKCCKGAIYLKRELLDLDTIKKIADAVRKGFDTTVGIFVMHHCFLIIKE